jgi:small GTP-binding protein
VPEFLTANDILSQLTMEQLAAKVVLLGDSGVGKTSIIHAWIKNDDPFDSPTVTCQTHPGIVQVDGRDIRLQVWDTAGQEKFRSMVPIYVRNSRAIVLVYDVANPDSFESLETWITSISEHVSPPYVMSIVGNKSDLRTTARTVVETSTGRDFAGEKNAHFCEVSAQNGVGIAELFSLIASEVFNAAQSSTEGVLFAVPTEQQPEQSTCCR